MPLLRVAFTILFISLLTAVQVPPAQAESCDACYERLAAQCTGICTGSKRPLERCLEVCQSAKCSNACAFKEVAPKVRKGADEIESGEQVSAGCESCMKQMERVQCASACAKRDDPAECARRCAKVKCSRKCSLPGTLTSADPVIPAAAGMTCKQCKSKEMFLCAQTCGDAERPGFTGCQVGCAEEKCLQICKPELF